MGSKNKIAKYIVPILQRTIDENNINTYIECFVGGANIIDKIKCNRRIGYDRSDTLIALLKQAINDPEKILNKPSRELWDKGKGYVKDGIMPKDMTLAEIGAIEFFSSYAAGGFPRGYVESSSENNCFFTRRANLIKQVPNIKDVEFSCQNYWELTPQKGALIYLDPPYANTKTYGYANQPKMDYIFFWNWVRDLSKDNFVYISEQDAPDDFEAVWEREVNRSIDIHNKYKAVEKLFCLKKQV